MKNELLRIGKLKLGIEAIKEKLIKHTSTYRTVEKDRRNLENTDLLLMLGNNTSPIDQILDVLLKIV